MPDKLEKLKSILNILDDKRVTQEEFIDGIEKIVSIIIEMKKRNEETVKKIEAISAETIEEINKTAKDKIMEVKLSDGKDGAKGDKGEDGADGKDADEKKIIKEVLEQIKIPTIEEITKAVPKVDGAFDFNSIKGLKKFYKEFKRQGRPRMLGGGGFSKIAMESKFVDDETPNGTVNGVNKDFTISNIPNPPTSLKVFLDGQRMKLTSDYTFDTRTITFITAPLTDTVITVDYRI